MKLYKVPIFCGFRTDPILEENMSPLYVRKLIQTVVKDCSIKAMNFEVTFY